MKILAIFSLIGGVCLAAPPPGYNIPFSPWTTNYGLTGSNMLYTNMVAKMLANTNLTNINLYGSAKQGTTNLANQVWTSNMATLAVSNLSNSSLAVLTTATNNLTNTFVRNINSRATNIVFESSGLVWAARIGTTNVADQNWTSNALANTENTSFNYADNASWNAFMLASNYTWNASNTLWSTGGAGSSNAIVNIDGKGTNTTFYVMTNAGGTGSTIVSNWDGVLHIAPANSNVTVHGSINAEGGAGSIMLSLATNNVDSDMTNFVLNVTNASHAIVYLTNDCSWVCSTGRVVGWSCQGCVDMRADGSDRVVWFNPDWVLFSTATNRIIPTGKRGILSWWYVGTGNSETNINYAFVVGQ